MTLKNDRTYLEKRKHLNRVTGQLGEAHKRGDFHEQTHQDQYSR